MESLKWSGKCPFCDEWGTLEESKEETSKEKGGSVVKASYRSIKDFDDKSSTICLLYTSRCV